MPTLDRRTLMKAALLAGGAVTVPLSPGSLQAQAQAQSLSWAEQKRHASVRGVDMAWHEVGNGDPIVFLHGNPTSSYLWRNIIPHVQHLGRCIAPDLVGMGDSAPLPDSGPGAYKFRVHRDYIVDLLEAIGVTERVTLVIHDWGSGIGLSYAQAHPDRVRGIAYMEAILRPASLPPVPEPTTGLFSVFRSPAGEEAVLQNNVFIDQILLGGLDLYLSDADKAEYRRPYLVPGESRRTTLEWPRELPRDDQPADTVALIREYTDWFAASEVRKLFVRVNPGAILASAEMLDFVRSFKNQTEVSVFGSHYVQEISPHAIGRALARWLESA